MIDFNIHTRYIKEENILWALNLKVCTTLICKAIQKKHNANFTHFSLPYTNKPNGRVICLFRHPVDRFISSLNQLQTSNIDDLINKLENNIPTNDKFKRLFADEMHLLPQCRFEGSPIEYYRYPDRIADVFDILKLDHDFINKKINSSPPDKNIILTEEQKSRIENFYDIDMKIWNKIQENDGKLVLYNYKTWI